VDLRDQRRRASSPCDSASSVAVEVPAELIAEDTRVAIPPLTFSKVGIGFRGDDANLRERFDSIVDEFDRVGSIDIVEY
jgi:hypothetical protein